MKVIRTAAVMLILISMLIPTGCWDLTDVNDHIFILGLGIDKGDKDGLYSFTFQYADPRGNKSDQSSDTMTYINSTITSSSLPLAVRELIRNSDSKANFEHLQALVLGADYLDIMTFDDIDILFRMASVRRKCVVVTSEIKASDLLSMNFSGLSTASLISRLSMHYSPSDSDVIEGFSLTAMYSKRVDNLSFYLLSIGAVENNNYSVLSTTDSSSSKDISIAVTGLSVFRNCRYVGRIGSPELETVRILSDRQSSGIINTVTSDNSAVCFQITSSKCRKTCEIIDCMPEFTINIELDCLLTSSEGNRINNGEKLIKEHLKMQIEKLILLSKSRYGGELLGLESAMRQQHRIWFEEHPDYWISDYPQAKISISIDCNITSTGIIE